MYGKRNRVNICAAEGRGLIRQSSAGVVIIAVRADAVTERHGLADVAVAAKRQR